MSTALTMLLAHLAAQRAHVVATLSGLDADQLQQVVVPSGWSAAALVRHLIWDDEVFWVHAVLGGDDRAIAGLRDGWSAIEPGPENLVEAYLAAAARSDEIIAAADLGTPPRWWPPAEVFPFPAFESGWHVVHRLLAETSTHAGHLDVARELIDGHQHLVVG